jgi:hypothetical protein
MKTSHKNARFQVLSSIAEDSSLVGCDCHWASGFQCFKHSYYLHLLSHTVQEELFDPENEDTMIVFCQMTQSHAKRHQYLVSGPEWTSSVLSVTFCISTRG